MNFIVKKALVRNFTSGRFLTKFAVSKSTVKDVVKKIICNEYLRHLLATKQKYEISHFLRKI